MLKTNKSADEKIEQIESSMCEIEQQLRKKVEQAKQYAKQCKCLQQISGEQMTWNKSSSQVCTPDYNDEVCYGKQFWEIYLKNEIALSMIKEMREQNIILNEMVNQIQKLEGEYWKMKKIKERKKNRRLAIDIEKKYICPYEKCDKHYGSEVSLNLHMKIKHNGGNKTDRQKIAEQICYAEANNTPVPIYHINFPPTYLQAFRLYYQANQRQYNEHK